MITTMFKDDMLQAVLDLNKNQTRRLDGLKEINKNPHWYREAEKMCVNKKGQTEFAFKKKEHWVGKSEYDTTVDYAKCKYKIGDIVGIRENFCVESSLHNLLTIRYLFDNSEKDVWVNEKEFSKYDKWKNPCSPKSKLFMFDSLIRHKIQITDIRVEMVQDITEQDAINEGVETLFSKEDCKKVVGIIGTNPKDHGYKNYLWHGVHGISKKLIDSHEYQYSGYNKARGSFSSLWDSINKKLGYGWDINPWLWVIVFKIISKIKNNIKGE